MRNPSFLFVCLFLIAFSFGGVKPSCCVYCHIIFFFSFFFFYLHTRTRFRGRYRIIGCARSVSFVHLKENADRREEQSSPSCAPVPGTQFSRLIFLKPNLFSSHFIASEPAENLASWCRLHSLAMELLFFQQRVSICVIGGPSDPQISCVASPTSSS